VAASLTSDDGSRNKCLNELNGRGQLETNGLVYRGLGLPNTLRKASDSLQNAFQTFSSSFLPEVLATDSKKPEGVWSEGGANTHSSG
jgi:hypothetical protein